MKQNYFTKSPTRSKMTSGTKRWAIAKTKAYAIQARRNSTIEAEYHRIINTVKALYMKPGSTYFERDYKANKSTGLLSMHSFLTPSFQWSLDCELGYDYKVSFAFSNCSYEQQIRKLLRAYPLSEYATEVTPHPDINAYYQRVQAYQSPEHFYTIPLA